MPDAKVDDTNTDTVPAQITINVTVKLQQPVKIRPVLVADKTRVEINALMGSPCRNY
jgi:hypothetical protein